VYIASSRQFKRDIQESFVSVLRALFERSLRLAPKRSTYLRVRNITLSDGNMANTEFSFLIAIVSLVLARFALQRPPPRPCRRQIAGRAASLLRRGKISSQEERRDGRCCGQRPKKDGSTITVSVISDKQGHYSFPASALEAWPLHAQDSWPWAIVSRPPRTTDLSRAKKKAATADPQTLSSKATLVPQLGPIAGNCSRAMPGTDDQEEFSDELRQLPHAAAHRPVHS